VGDQNAVNDNGTVLFDDLAILLEGKYLGDLGFFYIIAVAFTYRAPAGNGAKILLAFAVASSRLVETEKYLAVKIADSGAV